MKSCPECNRTFEDSLTFCLIDGSILSAPFDPHATLVMPEPRQTEPQPAEVLTFEEITQEISPTVSTPQHEQKSEGLASTIASPPAPEFESLQIKRSPAPPARKSNRLPLMIGALATFFIIGVAVFILANNRTDSTRHNPINENAVTTANTAVNYSVSSTNSNSTHSGASSDTETTSSNKPALTTERVSGTPVPRPSPSSTQKAPPVPSRSVNSGGKDNTIVAKPAEPDRNDSAAPCAGKAYQVCEPNETRRCNAATGRWECRRSR